VQWVFGYLNCHYLKRFSEDWWQPYSTGCQTSHITWDTAMQHIEQAIQWWAFDLEHVSLLARRIIPKMRNYCLQISIFIERWEGQSAVCYSQ